PTTYATAEHAVMTRSSIIDRARTIRRRSVLSSLRGKADVAPRQGGSASPGRVLRTERRGRAPPAPHSLAGRGPVPDAPGVRGRSGGGAGARAPEAARCPGRRRLRSAAQDVPQRFGLRRQAERRGLYRSPADRRTGGGEVQPGRERGRVVRALYGAAERAA